MEKELLEELATSPVEAIAKIKTQSKDFSLIDEHKKEYYKHDREIREDQVGKIQKDKTLEGGKTVKAVKIPINFAKKIVTTATAFEVGKPVTLIASKESELSKLLDQVWKANRINAAIHKLITLKKTETQAAIQFYIVDAEESSRLNKALVLISLQGSKKEIKSKVLDNTSGKMTPYFDGIGNMILFMWEYATKINDKTINYTEIWDNKNVHQLSDESGSMAYVNKPIPHGFDRIPIVYTSQDEPEWFDVKELIDRFEVAMSKGGDANDRTAHPILLTIGKIESLPSKDDNGKVINLPMVKDDEGKWQNGDAKFLESKGGNESHKNELEMVWKLIFSISQTADLSFESMKGLGNIAGASLKLLFLDAIIKAMSNESENRTMIERIINIIISGIVTTTNTNMKSDSASLFYDIIFNSIIPDDLKTASEIIVSLKEAGLLSKETAVKLLDLVEDPAAELVLINAEAPVIAPPVN